MLVDGANSSAIRNLALMVAVLVTAPTIQSQIVTAGAQYDVVSIKPNKSGIGAGGGMQYLPDGTFIMKYT